MRIQFYLSRASGKWVSAKTETVYMLIFFFIDMLLFIFIYANGWKKQFMCWFLLKICMIIESHVFQDSTVNTKFYITSSFKRRNTDERIPALSSRGWLTTLTSTFWPWICCLSLPSIPAPSCIPSSCLQVNKMVNKFGYTDFSL